MSTYEGNVSVILNTKGRLVLKADPDGDWSNADPVGLLTKMMELAKEHKADPVIYYGQGRSKGDPKTDRIEIRASRWKGGDPYMAMLPASSGTNRKPVKLA